MIDKLRAIQAIREQLHASNHVAVGALSPIPAAAALLARKDKPDLRVSLLGDEKQSTFTDGGKELFDCAAQGRIDTFFLSGVQIDRHASVNLVGLGSYPRVKRRFAGSFGSTYLYHLVPNVILFSWAHTPSVLVDKVDFISARGPQNTGEYRVGGPISLITNRCVFVYRKEQQRFALDQLMPGETVQSITENTGFSFTLSDTDNIEDVNSVKEVQFPAPQDLAYLNKEVYENMRSAYPIFAEKLRQETQAAQKR